MFSTLRKHRRKISILLLCTILSGLIPTRSYALTSGPSQPETQQFSPAGMGDLVDRFTGDFSYNIPLVDVGGYPVNINYASGITPDMESSWVGLGWNLNVGAVNRNVRGLPDDFSGDRVEKEFNSKPNQTYGLTGNITTEFFGVKIPATLNASIFYNNYNGFGMSLGVSPSVSAGLDSKGTYTANLGLSASLGSESGLEVTPKVGLKHVSKDGDRESTLGASLSFPYSSREGLKGMSLAGSFSATTKSEYLVKDKGGNVINTLQDADKFTEERGTFMGFASPSYTPSIEHEMYNVNASLNLTFGPTTPVNEIAGAGFGGYYSGQFLKSKSRSLPGYGYLYAGVSNAEDKLLDFNREKEAGFNKFTTNLPLTNHTYDIFQVSAQGVGGAYRLHRGDVGAVHDPTTSDDGYTGSAGLEFGAGPTPSTKVGVDLEFNYSSGSSGPWPSGNGIRKFQNNDLSRNKPGFEAACFKKVGDITPDPDEDYLEKIQLNNDMVRHELDPTLGGFMGDADLNGKYHVWHKNGTASIDEESFKDIGSESRSKRELRNTSFVTLTAKEAVTAGILPIENYKTGGFSWMYKSYKNSSGGASVDGRGYESEIIDRLSSVNGKERNQSHISEVRVTDESGARYIYGVPVYNTVQQEVTFAVNKGNQDVSNGLINYDPDWTNPDKNENGQDHYVNKVSTPPYATSYLLNAVLSADYSDRDLSPGPSDGDLGTYTKFNYTKVHDNFRWRTPVSDQENMASFSAGTESAEDDKGNYVYGEKEIWYLHSIETRTQVAEFHLKDREDGLGAASAAGKTGSQKLKYLDKIILYSKPDKSNSNPVPIKTVHFEYDYSLCPNTPNSQASTKGKLTLKKIWFTYGNSDKGILNPYVFQYADQDGNPNTDEGLNPSYHFQNYDRWGNYKAEGSSGRPNAEFPYVLQDSTVADRNAAVYALSAIRTPTGGTLRVYYESDDYAYVQNKRAMRMFSILGASDNGTNESSDNSFYDELPANTSPLPLNSLTGKMWLLVDLGEGFKPATADKDAEFRQKYLESINLMYYKVHLKVLDKAFGVPNARSEYVPGYAQVNSSQSFVVGSADAKGYYKKAKIRLEPVSAGDKLNLFPGVNPIVRNGWMYAKLHLNREMKGLGSSNTNELEQILRTLISQLETITTLATGFVSQMYKDGNSRTFTPAKSFVRLNEPDKCKLGGGHRVRALVMADNWNLMKSSKEIAQGSAAKPVSYYGQAYDYTYNENGKVISAGVASYEPILGGDENPFRLPVFVRIHSSSDREVVPVAPSSEYYLEEPLGESFFPAPAVGYRKVTITPLKMTSLPSDLANLKGNGTGKIEEEFYTAYDFPTITNRTDLQTFRHRPNILFKFMKFDSKDLVSCSQGYYVELNDMHGKQKSRRIYPEYGMNADGSKSASKPLSEVEYRYRLNSNGTLNNKVTLIRPDMTIDPGQKELGVETDLVQDERYNENTTIGGGLQFNLKYFQVAIVPIFVPTAFPQVNYEQTRFRSVVTTKVVNKYGILESTTSKDNGASITSTNLAYDAKTGKVLLTSIENEFHDLIYQFTYPGHWAYDRMDMAAVNEGADFTSSVLGTLAELKEGDELYVDTLGGGNDLVGYVEDVENVRQISDRNGKKVASIDKAKVIRSGRRNLAATSVGSIVSLDNPLNQSNGRIDFSGVRVLKASVNEFKDEWKRPCKCEQLAAENPVIIKSLPADLNLNIDPNALVPPQKPNLYVSGNKGNMRPWRSWTYMTDRTLTEANNDLNVRSDGYFRDFQTFWLPGGGKISPPLNPQDSKWQFLTETYNYNDLGMEVENRDVLSRYAMAQFGYGRKLPVAVSSNSQYKESGFEGFEDYDFGDCEDDHMGWREHKNYVTTREAHTGRRSIAVSKASKLKIRKVLVTCPVIPPQEPR